MRYALILLAACGSEPAPAKPEPKQPEAPLAMWPVPAGWKSETIPFPLEFAPSLAHRGVEELRFAPGFLKPGEPGYWSYAFTWRTEDAAVLDAPALGRELTEYFQGLVAAVDEKNQVTARDQIWATAVANDDYFTLSVKMFDAYNTGQEIRLVGYAERATCGRGALWVFVLSPPNSPLLAQLEALAAQAKCGQPVAAKAP
jgi:hypothetical protein